MGDRVSVSITIGGSLPANLVDDFVTLVQAERLSIDWGGEPFNRSQFPEDGPLRLFGQEIRDGEIAEIEDFCCTHDLPYLRWSGGAPSFGPEIVVWKGSGDRLRFTADEEERVVIDADEARELGTFEAIAEHFADGSYQPPAFRIAA